MKTSESNQSSRQRKTDLELRRKLIKKTLIAGGVLAALPDHWTSPLVESVMLPAHAQTSSSLSSVSLSTSALPFGAVANGGTSMQSVTITNTGTTTIVITGVGVS